MNKQPATTTTHLLRGAFLLSLLGLNVIPLALGQQDAGKRSATKTIVTANMSAPASVGAAQTQLASIRERGSAPVPAFPAQAQELQVQVSKEIYATTATGIDLYWTVYASAGRHPAVIVLHVGAFKSGAAGPLEVARDLATAGFLALAVEYRLAPTHANMNVPPHPYPGQNSVGDDGYYPEQTDDVSTAISAARRDPRCNGRVYCVGGSAGGSHAIYMRANGVGDSRPDLCISLSGVYQLDDVDHLNSTCVPPETCFGQSVMNYVGASDEDIRNHNFAPYMTVLHQASPTTYVTDAIAPLFVLVSSNDTGGVDTFQYPDLIAKLQSVGLIETTSAIPVAGHYKTIIVPVPAEPAEGTHAFGYWRFPIARNTHVTVSDAVKRWLSAGPPL